MQITKSTILYKGLWETIERRIRKPFFVPATLDDYLGITIVCVVLAVATALVGFLLMQHHAEIAALKHEIEVLKWRIGEPPR